MREVELGNYNSSSLNNNISNDLNNNKSDNNHIKNKLEGKKQKALVMVLLVLLRSKPGK